MGAGIESQHTLTNALCTAHTWPEALIACLLQYRMSVRNLHMIVLHSDIYKNRTDGIVSDIS